MDATDRMREAARHVQAAREALTAAYKELDAAAALAEHAIAFWTGRMRDSTAPCPPSELPDSRLGPALRKVRDHLRPAPGRPPSPLFDKVVQAVGLDHARLHAEGAPDADPGALWDGLLDFARRSDPAAMERAE